MMQPLEYADSAYDSTRPRDLPPRMERKARSLLSRAWLKHPLGIKGLECGEYRALDGPDDMNTLRAGEYDKTGEKDALQIYWWSLRNPLYWAAVLRFIGAFFAASSAVAVILGWMASLPTLDRNEQDSLMFGVQLVAGFSVVYFGIGLLGRFGLIPNNNHIIFDRRTGLIHLPPKGGRPRSIPFDEFAPYEYRLISHAGARSYQLVLGHQYSNLHILDQETYSKVKKLYLEWEFLQQFMDISKPLPDVPSLEPMRAHDPTTREWDRQMGRPPDLWRRFPYEDWIKLGSRARAAVDQFHWGLTRQQARNFGWRPSCYGEMTWWERSAPKTEKKKANHWKRCLSRQGAEQGEPTGLAEVE